MRKSLLMGLAALAFGVLPSCSNILEESGINPAVKGETGELRIALDADPTVSVTTKAGASKTVTLTEEQKKQFVIKATNTSDQSSVDLGTFADFANGSAKVIPVGTYSITSTYGTMVGELAFDTPTFSGTTANNVVVEANKEVAADITAKLTNSIISIDSDAFTAFKNIASVTELFAYSGDTEPSAEDGKFSFLSANNTLETTKDLFVKADAKSVNIVIKGTLIANDTKSFTHTSNLKTLIGADKTVEAAKNYNIKYALSADKGSLTLTINVDGTVTTVDLTATVDPYK